jgi:hypothetical protein
MDKAHFSHVLFNRLNINSILIFSNFKNMIVIFEYYVVHLNNKNIFIILFRTSSRIECVVDILIITNSTIFFFLFNYATYLSSFTSIDPNERNYDTF